MVSIGSETNVLIFGATPGDSGFFIVDRSNSTVDVRVERADDRTYYHLTPRGESAR